jgi:hypothetical protein
MTKMKRHLLAILLAMLLISCEDVWHSVCGGDYIVNLYNNSSDTIYVFASLDSDTIPIVQDKQCAFPIQNCKKAIVFESERSCLKYRSFFGEENDISCAVCGSNLIKYQFWLIQSCGAEEIIIGFDRQYKKIGDEEYYRWIKKLKDIAKKYFLYCNITFLFDTKNLLDYKDAPVDKGAKIFLQLFEERLDKNGKTR